MNPIHILINFQIILSYKAKQLLDLKVILKAFIVYI